MERPRSSPRASDRVAGIQGGSLVGFLGVMRRWLPESIAGGFVGFLVMRRLHDGATLFRLYLRERERGPVGLGTVLKKCGFSPANDVVWGFKVGLMKRCMGF